MGIFDSLLGSKTNSNDDNPVVTDDPITANNPPSPTHQNIFEIKPAEANGIDKTTSSVEAKKDFDTNLSDQKTDESIHKEEDKTLSINEVGSGISSNVESSQNLASEPVSTNLQDTSSSDESVNTNIYTPPTENSSDVNPESDQETEAKIETVQPEKKDTLLEEFSSNESKNTILNQDSSSLAKKIYDNLPVDLNLPTTLALTIAALTEYPTQFQKAQDNDKLKEFFEHMITFRPELKIV